MRIIWCKIGKLIFSYCVFLVILFMDICQAQSGGLVFSKQSNIFYMKDATATPVRLAGGDYPSISPDGNKVVFCKPVDLSNQSIGELLIYDIKRAKISSFYKAKGELFYPQWSPDGSFILFKRVIDYSYSELFVIKPNGSKLKKLVDSKNSNILDIYYPTWFPDSKSIYFHDTNYLYRIDLNGKIISKANLDNLISKKHALSSEDKFVVNPRNNNLILYSRYDTGSKKLEDAFMGQPNTSIYVYDTKTKKSKRLTDNTIFANSPAWSIDGKFIYFSGYKDIYATENYPFRIYRISQDGSGLTYIAMGEYPNLN